MLQEIEYGQSLGFEYYYPGYVLHKTTLFDYKLRLGKMEFYNHHKQWRSIEELPTLKRISDFILSKIETIELYLQAFNMPYLRVTYPAFPFAYFEFDSIYFVRTPIFLLLFEEKISDNVLILEYWQESDEYVISQISIHAPFQFFEQLKTSETTVPSPSNCMDLLVYNWFLAQENDPMTLFTTFNSQIQYLK